MDRDSGIIAHLFDERNPAVKKLLANAIQACNKAGKYIGICGQGPSDHADFAARLDNTPRIRDFVKRCAAVAGQTVEVRDKVLYVDGRRAVDPPRSKYTDPHILRTGSQGAARDHFPARTSSQISASARSAIVRATFSTR